LDPRRLRARRRYRRRHQEAQDGLLRRHVRQLPVLARRAAERHVDHAAHRGAALRVHARPVIRSGMSFYLIVREMKKLLHSLDGCLDKATAHAAAKKYDPEVLLQSRLAHDMLPLLLQILPACDWGNYAASRVPGKDAPSQPDTEKTIADVRKRIASTTEYL